MAGTNTAAEIGAEIEKIKGLISHEKLLQSRSALKREQLRTSKLEPIADKTLAIEIERAELGLAAKQVDRDGDKLSLAAAKDKYSYSRAKVALQQQQYRVELLTMQHSLAGAEESLRQLKSVAATLNHKIAAAPRLSFASVESSTKGF